MSDPAFDFQKLSPEERLQLIEELWDSLSDEDVPLTDAQCAELDRRVDYLEKHPDQVIPWEEVQRRLQRCLK